MNNLFAVRIKLKEYKDLKKPMSFHLNICIVLTKLLFLLLLLFLLGSADRKSTLQKNGRS